MAASDNDDKARLTTLQKLSRRAFLSRAGAAGVATAAATIAAPAAAVAQQQSTTAQAAAPTPPTGTIPITLKVNGKVHRVQIDPRAYGARHPSRDPPAYGNEERLRSRAVRRLHSSCQRSSGE